MGIAFGLKKKIHWELANLSKLSVGPTGPQVDVREARPL